MSPIRRVAHVAFSGAVYRRHSRRIARLIAGGRCVVIVDLRSRHGDRGLRRRCAQAMAEAEVGDDVYGEDPTVNALEREVAELLGHEAALFVPSGSMGNQFGMRLLVPPGKELVCDSLRARRAGELGAAAVFSGITFRTWQADRGRLDVARGRGADRAGRRPVPGVDRRDRGREHAQLRRRDGAAGRRRLRRCVELARDAGVCACTSTARGCGTRTWRPACRWPSWLPTSTRSRSACPRASARRSVRCSSSSAERIAEARIWRKRYGGGMRQAGILAAAGRYALAHHVERLADDHARARRLAGALGVRPGRGATRTSWC